MWIHKNNTKKTANPIKIVCGLLFIIFSFSYLYGLQSNLLANIQGVFSHWKTIYHPLVGAIGITLILLALQIVLNLITKWKGSLYSMSFLPFCLILGIFTHFDRGIYSGNFNFGPWIWIGPLIFVIYLVLSLIFQFIPYNLITKKLIPKLNVNLFILLLLFLGTILIGNTNEQFHAEMKMEQLIREGKFKEATIVDAKALKVSREMTVLRSYALARTDSLGQKLFEFPQYYRTQGLFFDDNTITTRLKNKNIFAALGGKPIGNDESTVHYLESLCNNNKGSHMALDYFLCSLLLDRQLEYFVSALDTYYEVGGVLYKHYQEALFMYQYMHSEYEIPFENIKMSSKFKKFLALQNKYAYNSTYQKNYTRREFGDTYWWYYTYGD